MPVAWKEYKYDGEGETMGSDIPLALAGAYVQTRFQKKNLPLSISILPFSRDAIC